MNLEQMTADARAFLDRQAAASAGPYKLRPGEYDDWGVVRRGDDGMPIGLFDTQVLIDEWTPKPHPVTPDWKAGPPQVESNAMLFVDAKATPVAQHVLELVERVRELEAALAAERETSRRLRRCFETSYSVRIGRYMINCLPTLASGEIEISDLNTISVCATGFPSPEAAVAWCEAQESSADGH